MFTRTEELFGKNNLDKIKNANILVVGIGGVGGYVTEILARTGVGKLTIIDYDKVDKTNINRQIIALVSTVGMLKTDVMKKRIQDINPNCIVTSINEKLSENNISKIVKNFDYVIDSIDNVTDKIALIIYCKKNNINIISAMGSGNRAGIPNYVVKDIYKTTDDGLARVLRKELRKNGVKNLDVVFSTESVAVKKRQPASVVYQPCVCACILASFVINSIIGKGE